MRASKENSYGSGAWAAVAVAWFGLSAPVGVSAGTSFGIFDARTLGMGGVSVASANNDNAQFYNAALLAFNDEIEERTQDSRFLLPLIVPQVSKSVIEIEEAASDDSINAIGRAVTAFNQAQDSTSAQAVADAAASLNSSLGDIEDEDVGADVYVGMALSEPGKWQGAGFFFGARVLVGGQPAIAATDRALLADYTEGLAFIASNGAQGVAHPELFDANGELIDPSGDFDSSATAAGAVITEAGVAASSQLRLLGIDFAGGFSFKVMNVETFEDSGQIANDRLDVDLNSESKGRINFDVGIVKPLGKRWRVGLAVKDIIPYDFDTTLGTRIRLRPRPRLGAAYQVKRLQVAVDADLVENQPLGGERSTQEAAIGAEWALLRPIKLRAGYRQDLLGHRDGIASAGAGFLWRRFVMDIAYAEGRDSRSIAMQLGYAF